jgi:hypothetical protein
MQVLFDLLGSTIIGGLLMFMVFNLNMFSTAQRYSSDQELRLQQNSKVLASMLDHDLRKIGYNYNGVAMVTALDRQISFRADIDSNGTTDLVTYLLGNTAEISYTENPRDRILYRIVNTDSSKGPSLGIINTKFSYMNAKAKPTTALDSIKIIKVELWLESPDPYEGKYPFTYWEMTINPRNI